MHTAVLRGVGLSREGAIAVGLGCRFPQSQGCMAQGLAGWDGEGLVGSPVQKTGRGQAAGGRNQNQPASSYYCGSRARQDPSQ